MVRDAQLEHGQLSVPVHTSWILRVDLEVDPVERQVSATRAWIDGVVLFGENDYQIGPRNTYLLEMEIGDGGPWRLRVPSRFLSSDSTHASDVPQDSADRSASPEVNRPGERRFIDGDGEPCTQAAIVDDPSQTFIEFDASDLAVLRPIYRQALAQAQKVAVREGVKVEPAVEDPAAFIKGLPRSRPGPRPEKGVGGGFSMM